VGFADPWFLGQNRGLEIPAADLAPQGVALGPLSSMTHSQYGLYSLTFLAVALVGCGEPAGPADVMRTWLGHLNRGEVEEAYGLVDAATRRRLTRAEDAWFEGRTDALAPTARPTEGAEPEDGLTLFRHLVSGPGFHGVPPLPANASERVGPAEIDGDSARVPVRTADGFEEAELTFESGSWRIAMLR